MITCPICGLAERTRGQRDIVFWCGYFVGLKGELRVAARCSNALSVVANLRAELAEAQAELRAVRAALAETGARLARALALLADGVEVARIGSELATADQLGEWWNVEGFQVEAANFLAGIMPPAPATPPGGEE